MVETNSANIVVQLSAALLNAASLSPNFEKLAPGIQVRWYSPGDKCLLKTALGIIFRKRQDRI